jgi:hypothetical protein
MGGTCRTHESEMTNSYKILVEKPERKGPLKDLDVDVRMKYGGKLWTEFICLRLGTAGWIL